MKCENRKTSYGFYEGNVTFSQQIFDLNNDVATQEYVASVLDYDKDKKMVKIEQRNYFTIDDELEMVGYDIEKFNFKVKDLQDEDGNMVEIANNPKKILYFKLDKEVKKDYFIRKTKM